ncbi:MAG: MoaD/ThiS family protein [Deltaproteobacteria bacterium]
MSFFDKARALLGGGPRIRVHVVVQGRIGAGWQNIDEHFALPEGATLGDLIDTADRGGFDLSGSIAKSPHLAHTLMLNGERCAVEKNRDRVLADGDQVFLLAPIAGG